MKQKKQRTDKSNILAREDQQNPETDAKNQQKLYKSNKKNRKYKQHKSNKNDIKVKKKNINKNEATENQQKRCKGNRKATAESGSNRHPTETI